MQLPILTNKDTYLHNDLFQLCVPMSQLYYSASVTSA